MTLLTAYDSVDPARIPADARFIFFYSDGRYANLAQVHAHFPTAHLCGITTQGQIGPGMCDTETGDLTITDTDRWLRLSLGADVWRPRVYANMNTWHALGLYNLLEHFGDSIRRAVALWDDDPTIPPGFDAKQYKNTPGYDVWSCVDDFFKPRPPRAALEAGA